MEVKVVAKHGSIPDDILKLIENKVGKLPRFFERTTGIQVVANLHDTSKPQVEIKLSAEHCDDFFASDSGPNVLAAVESVVDKMEKQLRKHKEKITNHHRGHEDRSHDE